MNSRALIVGSFVFAISVVLGSCAGGQPAPACPIAVGSPLGAAPGGSPLAAGSTGTLPNSWASYKKVSSTGACGDRKGEEVGFQKFEIPGKPNDTKVGIRVFTLGYLTRQYSAVAVVDYDSSNDKVKPDGGITLVPDEVYRVDPAMDAVSKEYSLGAMPATPTNNVCEISGLSTAEQNFQEESFDVLPGGEVTDLFPAGPAGTGTLSADGGTVTFPALNMKYEWSEFKVVSTGEVPGSIFTAKLKYTEGTCSANFDVTGIWPITLCHTDLDCSPKPLPDAKDSDIGIPARRFQGSGLNPAYETDKNKLKCNNDPAVHAYTALYHIDPSLAYDIAEWGVCEMTRPVSDFTSGN